MQVTKDMKLKMAELIAENIKKEFKNVHFTGNLMDTIIIRENSKGNIEVEIPAERYLFSVFREKGVIIPYSRGGSYANEVNKTGGFSGKHTGYIEKCINDAIIRWLMYYQISGRIK